MEKTGFCIVHPRLLCLNPSLWDGLLCTEGAQAGVEAQGKGGRASMGGSKNTAFLCLPHSPGSPHRETG